MAGPWFIEKPEVLPAIQDALHYATWLLANRLRGEAGEAESDTERVKVAGGSIENLYRVLDAERRKGKNIVVVWRPNRTEITTGQHSIESRLIWDRFSRDEYIGFIDVSPGIRNDPIEKIYHDFVHLEDLGHQRVASMISRHIAGREAI